MNTNLTTKSTSEYSHHTSCAKTGGKSTRQQCLFKVSVAQRKGWTPCEHTGTFMRYCTMEMMELNWCNKGVPKGGQETKQWKYSFERQGVRIMSKDHGNNYHINKDIFSVVFNALEMKRDVSDIVPQAQNIFNLPLRPFFLLCELFFYVSLQYYR